MLFVPWMRVNKLSVSSFEDEGYGMMVRSGLVFLYRKDEPIGTTIQLGDHMDILYVLRGHIVQPGAGAGGWLSETKNEGDVAFDRYGSKEESDSL